MGWLQDRWGRGPSMKGLRSSVRGTGRLLDNDLLKTAAALGLTATGIGAIPGALLMAGGTTGAKLMKGENIGEALEGGAKTGAVYGGSRALSAGIGKVAERFSPTAQHAANGARLDSVIAKNAMPAVSTIGDNAASAATSAAGNPMMNRDILSRFGGWVKDNPKDALIVAGKGAGGILDSRATNRQLAIMQQRQDLERQQVEEDQRRYEDEQRRRNQIGEKLSPHMAAMLRDLLARFGAQGSPGAPVTA